MRPTRFAVVSWARRCVSEPVADLASFYGGVAKTWRRSPLSVDDACSVGSDGRWYRARIDVTGTRVDMWINDQYIATQTFPSRDVLRGSFGIIIGNGKSAFRRVRYLARNRLDPAAGILAELRDAKRAKESDGGAINGSWIGLRPPFPGVERWVQGPRTSWDEASGSPQLLVLFGIEQNEKIRISNWLTSLHEEYANIGLRILNICQYADDPALEQHLASYPFPDSVGSDKSSEGTVGPIFKAFEIQRFNLPRVLLIDTDGRVVWEGDPGFNFDTNWSGEETLLSVPLEKLIESRKLVELFAWRKRWSEQSAAFFADGQLEGIVKLLLQSEAFAADSAPEAAEAHGKLKTLRAAVADPEGTLATLQALDADIAMDQVVELAKFLGTPIRGKLLKTYKKTDSYRGWKRASSALRAPLASLKRGKQPAVSDKLLDKLADAPGLLPKLAHEELLASKDDPGATKRILAAWDTRAARWLITEFFSW